MNDALEVFAVVIGLNIVGVVALITADSAGQVLVRILLLGLAAGVLAHVRGVIERRELVGAGDRHE